MNRRQFLKGTSIACGSSAFGLAIFIPTAASAADPFATMGLIHKGLGVISSFSGPSGTMSFMMSAALENQALIIRELEGIQVSLAEIRIEVANLPEELRAIVSEQFRDSLISSIAADAETYSGWLKASIEDSTIFSTNAVEGQMELMLSRVQNAIGTIVNSTEGRGPHAGFTIPIAASLEISLQNRLRFSESVITSSIDKYTRWIEATLSQQTGSIPNSIQREIDLHNSLIDGLPDQDIYRSLNFADFVIGSGAPQGGIYDSCIVYGSVGESSRFIAIPFKEASIAIALRSEGFTTMGLTSLGEYDDSLHGAKFLQVDGETLALERYRSTGDFFDNSRQIHPESVFGPDDDDLCYMAQGPRSHGSTDDLWEYDRNLRTNGALGKHISSQLDQARVIVAGLNLHRSKISFGYKAILTVENTLSELESLRGFFR